MNFRTLILLSICSITIFSCVSNRKIVYMQDLGDSQVLASSGDLVPYDVEEYRLQYNDVVDVTMKTNSAELNEILKIDDAQNQVRNLDGLNSGDAFFLNGYTVDSEGF